MYVGKVLLSSPSHHIDYTNSGLIGLIGLIGP